jgi:hypothetical protein
MYRIRRWQAGEGLHSLTRREATMTIIKCVTVAAAVLACATLAETWAKAQVLLPAPYTNGPRTTDGFGGWHTSPLTVVPGPSNAAPIPGWTNPKQGGAWTDPEESGQPGSVGASWRYPSDELFTR